MCCGNCSIIRTKSPDTFTTFDTLTGSLLNPNALPAVPVNPPTNVNVGHTLIQKYDNGLVYWTYNGANWTRNFDDIDIYNTHSLQVTSLNSNALPTVPVSPPTNVEVGHTLHERFNNGDAYWTWDGTAWVRDFVVVTEDIYSTHRDQTVTNIVEAALPTVPVNPPTGIIAGHTLHENYGNGQIFWTYDGTNWIRDYVITDCCHVQDDVATTLDSLNPPTAPVTPITNPTTGDTITENHPNGQAYWTWNGTTWNLDFMVIPSTGEIKHNQINQTASNINEAALPTVPITLPVNPVLGDTLHENYSNGSVYWTYNGTNWVRNFVITDCCHAQNDESASTINTAVLPTAPLNPITNPTTSDTIVENYSNGQVYWTFNGTNWVRDFVVVQEDIYNTHSSQASNINENALPTVPISPPANVLTGHTLHENYLNGQIFWTYNGTNWIRDYVITDCCHMQEDTATALDSLIPPTTPVTVPVGSTTGDTITENHTNGQAYWTYNGTTWVLDFMVIPNTSEIKHNHSDQTANNLVETALPTVPVTLPANPTTGDTLHEYYSNGSVYWTYNGTNWVRDYVITDCCHVQNNETGNTINILSLPVAPLNPTVAPTTGDTIIERYDNGQVYWTFNGTNWVRDFVVTSITADIYNTNSNQSANTLNEAIPPTVPVNPPVGVIDGHTLHENYSNGEAFWHFDGTNWVLDYIITNSCCISMTRIATFNCGDVHTAPVTPPTSPNTDDTYIEYFGNATRDTAVILTWQYNGTNWILLNTESNTKSFFADVSTIALDTSVLPTTPNVPGTVASYINGDTLHEKYSNGDIWWTYTNCVWVRTLVDVSCDCCDEAYITPILSADSQNVCVGTPINFSDNSIFHASTTQTCVYTTTTWDFGDGSATVVGQNVAHTFTTPGLYFVQATTACDAPTSIIQTIPVQISEVTAGFTATPASIAPNGIVTITNTSNANGCTPTYAWNFGDGSTSSLANPGTHTYTTNGNYTITLVVTCPNGCTDTHTENITVSSIVTINAAILPNTANICLGDDIVIADSSTITGCSGTPTYVHESSLDGIVWTQYATTQDATFTPISADTYQLRLTVTCDGTSQTSPITVITVTNVAVTVMANTTAGDVGDVITLTGNSVVTNCANPTYQWTLSVETDAPEVIATTQNATHTTDTDGTHTYTLLVTCNGCTASDSIDVEIAAAPVITLPCNDAVCYSSRTAAENPDATRQDWSDNGFNGTQLRLNGSTPQVFQVEGHATATVSLTTTGFFDGINIQNASTPNAAIIIRNPDSNATPGTLHFEFNEPVCGTISLQLSTNASGTNPQIDVVGFDKVGDRANRTPQVTWSNGISGTNTGVRTGGATSYAMLYFDNTTTFDITISNGQAIFGIYVLNACDAEVSILHCVGADTFYRFNGSAWIIDPSITAVGEWLTTAC